MPNNYFTFKQFTVQQGRCAMKVCTDACLFGAFAANFISDKNNLHILDIGTGTGLLSLMLAQKNSTAKIEAVEIDESAAQQAAENFAASPWRERLTLYHTSIQQFKKQSTVQSFTFILSNPPFFENDLKSDEGKRNVALHSAELNLAELLDAIDSLLAIDGCIAVLLPYHRTGYFEKLAANKGFHLTKKVMVKQTGRHDYFRSIVFFSREKQDIVQEEICIREESNNYSPAFIRYLRDYYLYL